jgi:AraC-like DNA-binding protein
MDRVIGLLYNMVTMKPSTLVFLAGSATRHCTARVDKHFLGYHTLQYMDSGSVELSYGEERHALAGFWFWPAMPGPRIRFHAMPGTAEWSHRFIAFSGPLVLEWQRQGLLLPAPQRVVVDQAKRMDEILALKDRREVFSDLRAVRLLELLLIDLAEARQAPAMSDDWLETVLRLLQDSRYWPDYPTLCADWGMSLPTLRRRFRKAMRISLHGYAMQARVSQACTLLTQTDLPIKAVADQLGYRDVYFFSRQFRELTGFPPKRFRSARQ